MYSQSDNKPHNINLAISMPEQGNSSIKFEARASSVVHANGNLVVQGLWINVRCSMHKL